MLHFVDCNSNVELLDTQVMTVSEKTVLENLKKSMESGLIPDREAGIFVREGYGALVGYCPENCKTIDDLLPYWSKKFVENPTLIEKIRRIMRKSGRYARLYSYGECIDEGYDLVIGPGGSVGAEKWEKAVYCRNYKEILERSKSEGKAK